MMFAAVPHIRGSAGGDLSRALFAVVHTAATPHPNLTQATAIAILSLPPPHPPTRRPGPPDPVTPASSSTDLATWRRGEAGSRPLRPARARDRW